MKKIEDILLGTRIRKIRSSLGMDQKQFAKEINATVSALSNWENGRNKPNDNMIEAIASLGGISAKKLIYGSLEEYVNNYITNLTLSEDWQISFQITDEMRKDVVDSAVEEVVKNETVRKFYEKEDFRAVNVFLHNEAVAAILRNVNQTQFTNKGVYNFSSGGISDILKGLKKYREYGASIGLCDDIEKIVCEASGKISDLYEKYQEILE